MAIKTFTTGEVLTASDTNTYLANAGLVYIAGTTLTTSVSYVEILNCFSSTYDNYRVVVNNAQATTQDGFGFYLGTNPSNALYYGSLYYDRFDGAATATARTNGGVFLPVGLSDSAGPNLGVSFDLNAPNLAKQKTAHGTYDGRNFAGWFGGLIADSTQYTGIRFRNASGNLTAGTYRIYGYRQA